MEPPQKNIEIFLKKYKDKNNFQVDIENNIKGRGWTSSMGEGVFNYSLIHTVNLFRPLMSGDPYEEERGVCQMKSGFP